MSTIPRTSTPTGVTRFIATVRSATPLANDGLVVCSECTRPFSDMATACPHCDSPVSRSTASSVAGGDERAAAPESGIVRSNAFESILLLLIVVGTAAFAIVRAIGG
jgi:hypothetical protein